MANYQFTSEIIGACIDGHKEVQIDVGYRIDLLVENEIILEIKAVKELEPIHTAQVLTYLKLKKYILVY